MAQMHEILQHINCYSKSLSGQLKTIWLKIMPVAAAAVIHLAWNCLINTRPKLKTWLLNPVPFPRKKRQTFSGLLSSSRHVFTNLFICKKFFTKFICYLLHIFIFISVFLTLAIFDVF